MFIDIVTKKNVDQKRTVKSKTNFNISTKIIVKISIFYYDNLSNDRDFLFEFQCLQSLSQNDEVRTWPSRWFDFERFIVYRWWHVGNALMIRFVREIFNDFAVISLCFSLKIFDLKRRSRDDLATTLRWHCDDFEAIFYHISIKLSLMRSNDLHSWDLMIFIYEV